jgi:hypothetical protein
MPLFCFEHYFMIVKELFGTHIINAPILNANSNISVKYYSKDFPSVVNLQNLVFWFHENSNFVNSCKASFRE